MTCEFDINTDVFQKYCMDTAKLYVELYNQYYIIPNVHKILIHGSEVLNTLILPIGKLSEDVQEIRHKEKKIRNTTHVHFQE